MAKDLHELAVDAEAATEKLATALADAQAEPNAVKAVDQCADVLRKVVKALGAGQEATGDQAPPPDAEQAPQEQPRTIEEATNQMPVNQAG